MATGKERVSYGHALKFYGMYLPCSNDRLFIQYVWDPPLLAVMYFVGYAKMGRFLGPFCTIINDQIGKDAIRHIEALVYILFICVCVKLILLLLMA